MSEVPRSVIISKTFLSDPFVLLRSQKLPFAAAAWKMSSCRTARAANSGCCPDLLPFLLLASKGRVPSRPHPRPGELLLQVAVARAQSWIPSLPRPPAFFENQGFTKDHKQLVLSEEHVCLRFGGLWTWQ